MVNVNNGALRGLGGRCNISSVGGSVALVDKAGCSALSPHHHHGATARGAYRASAAKVSIIRLSHSNWTALKTLWLELLYIAVTTVRQTAVMLTVS